MAIEKRDQISLGLNRLLEQFKDKPNIEAILTSYLQQINDLEDTYESLLNERSIFTAVGAQLDLLGALVNEARLGRSDSVYRLAILTRIGINNSEGTPNQILSLLKNITGATKVNMWEHFPVSAIYYANVEFTGEEDCISNTLQIISPATSGNVVTLFDPDEDALILSEMALTEFFMVDENGNLVVTAQPSSLVTDTGDLIVFDTGDTVSLTQEGLQGEFITGEFFDHVDDGRLEYAYLSEILPHEAEVRSGSFFGTETLAGEPFMEAGEPLAEAAPVVSDPEGWVISADGVTTEPLEIWTATVLESTESPYGIPVEACTSTV